MLRRTWLAAIALFAFAPTLARAQVVSGEVTDSTNRPISGVVVMSCRKVLVSNRISGYGIGRGPPGTDPEAHVKTICRRAERLAAE